MGSAQILGLVAFLMVLYHADAIVAKPENSLVGPYIAGGENLAWWDLTGSAQLADRAIRLTTDESEKQGAVWNSFPNVMNDWEFHSQFHIHGKGVHVNGEGMAFWYVREPHIAGPIFGYRDYFSGLGVFIDTFEDPAHPHHHKHPYLSAVVNNGSQHYEHIEEGTVTQVGGCYVAVRNLEWHTRIAISYINQVLSVYMDAQGTDSWIECFRSSGVHLPTGYYFGVSASTGMVSDNHDVISITTLDMNMPDKPYENRNHVVPHAEFVQIPPRPASSEQSESKEEVLPKIEVKREVHPEEIIAEVHIPVPEVKIPEVHIPEVHIPEVHIPEVQIPEVHIPEVKIPEPKISEPEEHKHPEKKLFEPPTELPKSEPRKSEPEKPDTSISFMRKAIYVAGVGVILYVAIVTFKQYYARRKERIQKRLY